MGYGRQVERQRRHEGRRKQTAIGSFDRTHHFGDSRVRLGWKADTGPRSEERGRRQDKHKHSITQGSAHALETNDHDTSRPTLNSRPVPMQFTSPHPAPDWLVAARASDDLALQRAPSRARAHRTPRPLPPRRAAQPPPAARPYNAAPRPHSSYTFGESQMSTASYELHSLTLNKIMPKTRPVCDETRNTIYSHR